MSDSITEREVRSQLAAMASDRFDLGALSESGRMMLSKNCAVALIPSAIRWLRQENAQGAHIFIRPHGPHSLGLIDDLTAETITAMKRDGFAPALIVETSLYNFQAWLNHGRILDPQTSTSPRRNWRSAIAATVQAPTGGTSDASPDSRIRSSSDACPTACRPS